jgi:hypothetical protein
VEGVPFGRFRRKTILMHGSGESASTIVATGV